jgi:uncharacterized protein (TIGR02996 family)
MPTDADFLAAIRANPGDDAPWLLYADWLTERNGDPVTVLNDLKSYRAVPWELPWWVTPRTEAEGKFARWWLHTPCRRD